MRAVLTALALAATAGAAQANEIRVALDEAEPVALPDSARGVVIGNPQIAGVTVQDDRLLFITGKAYGATNLIVVGEGGRTVLRARIRVVADEAGAVMVIRGTSMQRFDCAPECRRRPDLSDDPNSLSSIMSAITSRGGGGQ